MIHYQLRCSQAHEFDGWFRDSAAFDKQARRGLLQCPECGDTQVTRALMTPSVPKKGRTQIAVPPPATPAPPEAPQPVAGGAMPDHMRATLQRMRAEVEKNCDYVGPGFADEARKIYRGESDKRGIYGEASSDEAEALADEGIHVSRIPWVPRADG